MINMLTIQNKYIPLLEQEFPIFFAKQKIPEILRDSMLYSLQTGGKRLRPLLLFTILQAYGKEPLIALEAACAIEMLHTYSLIHDDLPAMDNDDFRRGKPTNHKVFGEGIAILAGDALQVAAFEIVVSSQVLTSSDKLEIINKLTKAVGPSGMIAGQILDISSTVNKYNLESLQEMHVLKTGRLIEVCVLIAVQLSNLDDLEANKLQQFAYYLGLAFQVQDDIIDDLEANVDCEDYAQRCTYPALLTMEGANKELVKYREKLIKIVSDLNCEKELLRELISLFLKHKY